MHAGSAAADTATGRVIGADSERCPERLGEPEPDRHTHAYAGRDAPAHAYADPRRRPPLALLHRRHDRVRVALV
ncbi:hypothetical protein GCM10028815_00230 [Mariniluteicoccus flavus]